MSRKVQQTVQNVTSDMILHLKKEEKKRAKQSLCEATSAKATSIPQSYQEGVYSKWIKTFRCNIVLPASLRACFSESHLRCAVAPPELVSSGGHI